MVHIGVFFGGASVEHEVSIITAIQAIQVLKTHTDKKIIPIYIAKDLKWYTGDCLFNIDNFKDLKQLKAQAQRIQMVKSDQGAELIRYPLSRFKRNTIETIHVAFPIIHGTTGEDGTLQGYFEHMDIPYVGCDVLSASMTMDKITTKLFLLGHDVPQIEYTWFSADELYNDETAILKRIEDTLDYPVIVKPADVGSSVGVTPAKDKDALLDALHFCTQFSNRVIVERMVQNLREVNISVMGDGEDVKFSCIEEPISESDFLSYEDKYQSGGSKSKGMSSARREIPANITEEQKNIVESIAVKAFKLLDASGVSRLDFIIDGEAIFLNEINTIPGSLAFYLWEATNVTFEEQLSELIEIAYKKNRRKKRLLRSTDSNILSGVKLGVKK